MRHITETQPKIIIDIEWLLLILLILIHENQFSRASLKVSFIGRILNLIQRRAAIRLRSTVSSASVHTSQRHTVILYVRRLIVSSASLLTLHGSGVWLTQSFNHAKSITNVQVNWECCERSGRGLSYGIIWKSTFRYSGNTIKIIVKIMTQPRFEPGTYVHVKTFAAWANLLGPNITERHLTQWSTYLRKDCGCKCQFYCKKPPANNNRFRLLHFFIDLEVIPDQFFCWPVAESKIFLLKFLLHVSIPLWDHPQGA